MLVVHLNLEGGLAGCRHTSQQVHHGIGHTQQTAAVIAEINDQVRHTGLFKKGRSICEGGGAVLWCQCRIYKLPKVQIAYRCEPRALDQHGFPRQRRRRQFGFRNGQLSLGTVLLETKASLDTHLAGTKNLLAGRSALAQLRERLEPVTCVDSHKFHPTPDARCPGGPAFENIDNEEACGRRVGAKTKANIGTRADTGLVFGDRGHVGEAAITPVIDQRREPRIQIRLGRFIAGLVDLGHLVVPQIPAVGDRLDKFDL